MFTIKFKWKMGNLLKSMRRDGKDKFYRTLNLNQEDKKLLKWAKKIFEQMKKDEGSDYETKERT